MQIKNKRGECCNQFALDIAKVAGTAFAKSGRGVKRKVRSASDGLTECCKPMSGFSKKGLLPTEGNIGTYDKFIFAGWKGDNIPYSCIKFGKILIGGALLQQLASFAEKLRTSPMVKS